MKFTTKQIEELATNTVKDSILTTDLLDQFIDENSTEPSWDGFVYIYKDSKKRKQDFVGRVAVQVKGTLKNKVERDKISFSVDVVDLKSFRSDGGVMYFVVYITPDKTQRCIYYNALVPVKIDDYLNRCEKNQKEKSIEFLPFPLDNTKKVEIFLECCKHCKKQKSFRPDQTIDMFSQDQMIELMKSSNGRPELRFSIVNCHEKKNPIKALLKNDVYFYAKRGTAEIPFWIGNTKLSKKIKLC